MKKMGLFWKIFPPVLAAGILPAFAAAWVLPRVSSGYLYALMILAAALPVAALAAWWLTALIGGSLERLTQGIARLGMGRFDEPAGENSIAEITKMAETLNRASKELEGKITSGASETQSGEAILSCIEEGVIAVDRDRRILKLNPKARQILNIITSRPEGLPASRVISHGELLRFVEEGLETRTPDETEFSTDDHREGYIRAARSPLYHSGGEYWGLVLAIKDVTRLRRLENMRKDFAANVSHELKTPVTSIKGFVETLKGGAVDNPEKARQFLDIIERHIDRLTSIIDDLLSLAKIEKNGEAKAVSLKILPVRETLEKAIAETAAKAEAKKIRIELDCDPGIEAPINAPLLESGVINLIDNALNYSEEGKIVWVEASLSGGALSIHVRDQGCGIEKSHLDRIFERFYRVDAARSRKLGGTGLGLSIVKHIALAHGGRVSVKSAPGEGSVFSIHIPVEKNEKAGVR